MLDMILVGVVIVAAAAFTIYRVFVRPSCGCGKGSNCCSHKKISDKPSTGGCGGKKNSCCCGH